jgi:hypothetical protein
MTTEEQAVNDWLKRWRRKDRRVAGRCIEAMREAPRHVELVWGLAWSHERAVLHAWGLYGGRIVDPTVAQLGVSPVGYAELLDEDGRPLLTPPLWAPLRRAEGIVLGTGGDAARRLEELRPYLGRRWHTDGALPVAHVLCAWWECSRDFQYKPTIIESVERWRQKTAAWRGAA